MKKASSFFIRISIETIIISFLSFLCVSVANTAAKEREEELEKMFGFSFGTGGEKKEEEEEREWPFCGMRTFFVCFFRVRRGGRGLLKVEKKKSRQQIGAGRENKRRSFQSESESYFHSEWMG